MKTVLTVVAALLFAAAVGAGIYYGEAEIEPPADAAETGPQPRAVVAELVHEFGTMQVGTERSHAFAIRNEGEAALELKRGHTTCKCTLSELARDSVPPGGSTEIELTWTPKNASPEYLQRAEILTNDPKNPVLILTVTGTTVNLVEMTPREVWSLGTIEEDRPTTVTGTIHSALLDEFQVLEVAGRNPYLTGEAIPLDAARLKELQARSGYEIQVTLSPEMSGTRFREQLVVRTDVPGHETFTMSLIGARPGPVKILPLAGFRYAPETRTIDLGTISAETGKQAELLIFIETDEAFRFEETISDPEFLKVTVTEEKPPAGKTQRRYRLVVAFPPAGPPITRVEKNAGKVTLRTNDPELPELTFPVRFIAY